MHKILVTGGAGFIGTHVCLLLLENGFEVIAIDSLVNSDESIINNIRKISQSEKLKFKRGDVRSKSFLKEIFYKEKNLGNPIVGVIHLAGLKYVSESFENPIMYWDVNVCGSINLLEVMQLYNCYRFVFSSSATIYDASNNCKLSENSSIKPLNPYGFTKLAVEDFLNNLYLSNNKKWGIFILRYFNPIGAHSSRLIGENARGESRNIFSLISNVALGVDNNFEIFGSDWPTFDGTPVRDYVHIMDLANGHLKAIQFLMKNSPNFYNINLGSGNGFSVLELIKVFEKINKVKIPYSMALRRKGDPCYLVADISLAKKILKWIPQFSIEDMCASGWNWELTKLQKVDN